MPDWDVKDDWVRRLTWADWREGEEVLVRQRAVCTEHGLELPEGMDEVKFANWLRWQAGQKGGQRC